MTLLVTSHLETEHGVVRIADRAGTGDGVPLVFVHGYPDNLQIWSRVIEHLPGRRCIAFDWPGLGHSEAVISGGTPFHLARHLVGVLDALELDHAVPVGFDMGAHAVVVAASRVPDRIRRLVLTNFLADGSVATSWDIAIMRRLGLNRLILRHGASVIFSRALRTFLDQEGLDAETKEDLWSGFQRPEVREHLRRMCAGYQAALPRVTSLYPQITSPTLVVWANQDPHFPVAQAEALTDALVDATLHLVDAKHWMMWQQPAALAEKIDRFCQP